MSLVKFNDLQHEELLLVPWDSYRFSDEKSGDGYPSVFDDGAMIKTDASDDN